MSSNRPVRLRFKKTILSAVVVIPMVVIGLLYDYFLRYDKAVFYVGHSLVSFEDALVQLARTAGVRLHVRKLFAGGASLRYHWQSKSIEEGQSSPRNMRIPTYDFLVLTERVLPLEDAIKNEGSASHAAKFIDLMRSYHADVEPLLYETWHRMRELGETEAEQERNWRKRLTEDLVQWQSIAEGVHREGGPETMKIIPAGQAMALLYDEISAGNVPGITTIRAMFRDDVHLNSLGDFFVACVHFSALLERSPVGLEFEGVESRTARSLQEIAWTAVSRFRQGEITQ